MNKKVKLFLGLFLILISITTMIFWEAKGREMIMNQDILVAKRDIQAGEVCSQEDLAIISVTKNSVMTNSLNAANISQYIGKKFKHDINMNSQIPLNAFISGEKEIAEGMTLFKLRNDWIMNLSNSIRKGDYVKIYSCDYLNVPVYIGNYYVAFVKDSSGREVTETSGFSEPRILERTGGISVPSEVEIAATLEDYSKITSAVYSGSYLILMQEEVSMYE